MGHHVDYGAYVAKAPRSMPSSVKMGSIALMVLGIAAAAFGFSTAPVRTGGAFIVNFMYWAGIAQGGMMLAVALVIVKGRWGRPLKRMCEAFCLMMIPMYVLLMVFLLAGGLGIYEWSHWTASEFGHLHKWVYFFGSAPAEGVDAAPFPWFFVGRVGILLAVLITVDLWFIRTSVRSDMGTAMEQYDWKPSGLAAMIGNTKNWKGSEAEAAAATKRQAAIAPLLGITYAVVFTVMAVDLSMSLMPHWFANMFPAWYFMSCIWSGFVYLAIFSMLFGKMLGIDGVFTSKLYHDLGKLTLGFTMFWAYTLFAQYLPIWYGNMTEETVAILIRTELEPWATLTRVVVMLCFLAPFAMLTSRGLKKVPAAYLMLTGVLAIGIWLERFWVNMPSIWMDDTLPLGWVEVSMSLGFLGMFTYVVIWFLTSVPPLTFTDPYMQADPDHVHVVPTRLRGSHHH
jgi:hypothetical protein